ncbi:MAG TPA: DUF4783 domain-containing protein [Thermoanaerobaculia bacterium]|jgi:hypothetical protein|nr:DUF4783 domain-containing protein [Thermoanaerobaculia bacterium]
MKLWTRIAFVMLFIPLVAQAQFRDLDSAVADLERGFGGGDVAPIVSGISADGQVQLQFPGLADKDGFFGRDQAAYLLESLFNKVKPTGFERVSAKGARSEGQYHIKARWSTGQGDRDLYITLQSKNDRWVLVSVRSAG